MSIGIQFEGQNMTWKQIQCFSNHFLTIKPLWHGALLCWSKLFAAGHGVVMNEFIWSAMKFRQRTDVRNCSVGIMGPNVFDKNIVHSLIRRHRLASGNVYIPKEWFTRKSAYMPPLVEVGPVNVIFQTVKLSSIILWSNSDARGPIAGAGDSMPSARRLSVAVGSVGPECLSRHI